jgi:hypothetical protein
MKRASVAQDRRDLVGASLVEIVVAEDGAHGDRQPAARVREHRRLLRLAVGRQVAGEQDEVGFFL